MAQANTIQQAAKQQLRQGRHQARQKEPRMSYAQALLDSRNEREYQDLGLTRAQGEEMSSPDEMKSKLWIRKMQARQIRNMATRQGVDPESSLNSRPQATPEAPLQMKTGQGRAAQQYIDDSTPESQKPRGLGDVDPTSINDLRSQMRNLELRRRQTQKKTNERADIDAVMERQRQRIQKAVKRKVEAAAKRGIIYVIDFIAGCLDISSTGISFLIDVFFYIFTFGWLNLEMIYGRHFKQGKDLLISPISWDPIPVPVDPEAVVLQGFLVIADLAILFISFILFLIGVCIMYDFSVFQESPYNFVITMVTNAADLCTGDIIKQMFGI